MYVDLNVPWPGGAPEQAAARLAPTLEMLVTLGYDVVAVAVEATSTKAARAALVDSLAPALPRLQERFPQLKLLARATLVLDDSSPHQNVSTLTDGSAGGNGPGFDVIAVLPQTEKQLQSCASSLDIDLICIETAVRVPFALRHKLVGSAIARGVRFELSYSAATASAGTLRQCIANAATLIRATRSRGIVVSSGATSPAALRAPLDVANVVSLWGLKAGAAHAAVSTAASAAATQGILRRRSAKQVVLADGNASGDEGAAPRRSDGPAKKKQRQK